MKNPLVLIMLLNLLGAFLLVIGALFQFCIPHDEMEQKTKAALTLSCFVLGAMLFFGNSLLMLIAFGFLFLVLVIFIIWGFCRMLRSFFPARTTALDQKDAPRKAE